MKKIGLLGGTFDPIHNGHIQLALKAMEICSLDEIIFVPNYQSPFKLSQAITCADDRKKMIELAIEPFPLFSISTIELQEEKVHYTFETIQYFKELYPNHQLYFIAGSDILTSLSEWKNFDDFIHIITFIIASRNTDHPLPSYPVLLKYPSRFVILKISLPNISSTQLRLSLNPINEPLLPKKVAEYIVNNKLYK